MNVTMKLKSKLTLIFSLIFVLVAMSGYISHTLKNQTSDNYEEIVTVKLPKAILFSKMVGTFREIRIQIRSLAFEKIDEKTAHEFKDNALAQVGKFQEQLQQFREKKLEQNEAEVLSRLESEWQNFVKVGVQLVEATNQDFLKNKDKIVQLVLVDCPAAANKVQETLDELLEIQNQLSISKSNQAKYYAEKNTLVLIGSILFVGLFCLGIGFWATHHLGQAIKIFRSRILDSNEKLKNIARTVVSQSEELQATSQSQVSMTLKSSSAVSEISDQITKTSEETRFALKASSNSLEKVKICLQRTESLNFAMEKQNQVEKNIQVALQETEQEIKSFQSMIK